MCSYEMVNYSIISWIEIYLCNFECDECEN